MGKPETHAVALSLFAFMCDDVNDLSSTLNRAVLHLRFKGLTAATAMRITVSRSFAPRKPKPFTWRQTAFGFSSAQFCHSSHPVWKGGLLDLCEIRFLPQKNSIYCPLHAVFFTPYCLSGLLDHLCHFLREGVKNCAVQIIASVPIWCSHICCISILLGTLVRCQLLVLFMYAHFLFQSWFLICPCAFSKITLYCTFKTIIPRACLENVPTSSFTTANKKK